MAARCLRGLWLVLLVTSWLGVLPPPLAAQSVRYAYDALGRLTLVSTPEDRAIGATEGLPYCSLSLKPRTIFPSWISSRPMTCPRALCATASLDWEGVEGII